MLSNFRASISRDKTRKLDKRDIFRLLAVIINAILNVYKVTTLKKSHKIDRYQNISKILNTLFAFPRDGACLFSTINLAAPL